MLHLLVDRAICVTRITNNVMPLCFYHLFESHIEGECVLKIIVWLSTTISIVLSQAITLKHKHSPDALEALLLK